MSDIFDAVSLLSFSKFSRMRGVVDGAGLTLGSGPFRRRLPEPSSSDSRLRFVRVCCRGSIGLSDAVEAGSTGLVGRGSRAGELGWGISCAWAIWVEDRVALLNGGRLMIEVSSERAARVLLEAVAVVFLWTLADGLPKSSQYGRLRKGEGEGEEDHTDCRSLRGRECSLGRHIEWRRMSRDTKVILAPASAQQKRKGARNGSSRIRAAKSWVRGRGLSAW